MSVNKKIKIFLQILGPLIFIYILSRIDYQILFKEIKSLKWYFLMLTLVIMVAEVIFRSLRWRVVLISLGLKISKPKALSFYWLGTFFSMITPGRVGELIKVYFLKKRGLSAFRSFFSIVLDRLIDILVLLFFSVLIFTFFLRDIGSYLFLLGIIVLLAIILVFLIIDQRTIFHRSFGKLIQKIFPINFSDYNRFTFKKLIEGIKGLNKKIILYFSIYLIVGWVLYFFAKYTISLSLGLNLSFVNLVIVSVLVIIINILPISIAGLGTREAAIIYFFSISGIDKETALLFSLLILAADLIVISFGIIPYLKELTLINKIRDVKTDIYA